MIGKTIVTILLSGLAIFLIFLVGMKVGAKIVYEEAIEHKCGNFEINDGIKQFKWRKR